jgi:radical SAM protein with 4Fe4S-binding SPASM domain
MALRAPISVDINITRRCNLRCSFCSANPAEVGDPCVTEELSLEELHDLFEQIEEMGVFYIRLAGGEPLIRADIYDILKDLRNFSFYKLVLTNGIPLSRRMTEALAEAGMSTVGISLDGPTAELHDRHRGVRGTFRRVMKNLEHVRAVGLDYSAQFVVTSFNVVQLVDMVKLCEAEGFSALKFILLNLSGKARDTPDFFPTFPQWSAGLLRLTDFLKETAPIVKVSILPPHEDPVPYELYFPLKNAGRLQDLLTVWRIDAASAPPAVQVGCAAGRTQLTIFEDGSVYGCDLMKDHDIWNAGNVRRQSLQDIWDTSPIFRQLRVLHKTQLEGMCGSCSFQGCGGGCRASAYNLHAAIDASDSNCLLTRV